MTTLNISLPEQMRSFIESQVSKGFYSTASDYIRDLIRDDQKRKDQAKLESLLLEALEGDDPQEFAPEFFERLRERARQAIKAKEGKTSCDRAMFTGERGSNRTFSNNSSISWGSARKPLCASWKPSKRLSRDWPECL